MFYSKHFQFSDIPDLSGKIAIVTGSNAGLGKVSAIELARKNCHVIVASRSEEKGKTAVAEIKKITGNDKVEFMKLDLLSLSAVKSFADEFASKYDRLHILMNNAGVMFHPFELSKDGFETHFATNHLAHFYLTMLLLPLLQKSRPSRIVNVSSSGHLLTSLKAVNLDTLNDEKSYNKFFAYSISKAFNILFTRELNKRLEAKGIDNIYVNAAHPGLTGTDLARHSLSAEGFLEKVVHAIVPSAEVGVLTQLYLATSPEVESKNIKAQYYVPTAKKGSANGYCSSDENAARLWVFSEDLLKASAPDYQGAPL